MADTHLEVDGAALCGSGSSHLEKEWGNVSCHACMVAKQLLRKQPDPVNHPPHYVFGKFEVIDVIEDWGLGFSLGNAVKYIARAGRKDPERTLEDLQKARWYLEREIARLEQP